MSDQEDKIPDLTPEQLVNWRRIYPELKDASDKEVQALRDALQEKVDKEPI